MGVDQSFYVGPVVICEPYETEVERKSRVCPKNCDEFKKGRYLPDSQKFCSGCGSQIEEQTRKVKARGPETGSLYEDMGETLSCIQIQSKLDYWVPNTIKWGQKLRIYLGKYEELVPVEFDGMMIENDLATFRKHFAEELKILEEEYKGKVRVSWAATSWCW